MKKLDSKRCAAAGLLFALAVFSSLSLAQDRARDRDESESELSTFVLGNFEFVLLHELAHMLIRERNIPIIGPEENAADYIAVMILLQTGESSPEDQPLLQQFVASAANALGVSWDIGVEHGMQIPYWDAHGLGIQRYYSIVCLLYGSDPNEFEDLLEESGLPESRSAGCEAEFKAANESVQWLRDTFGRQSDDPESAAVDIVYEDPRTLMGLALVDTIRSRNLLEQTIEAIRDGFLIETPFTAIVGPCGQAEGAWIPSQRELIICHELLDAFYQFAAIVREDDEER